MMNPKLLASMSALLSIGFLSMQGVGAEAAPLSAVRAAPLKSCTAYGNQAEARIASESLQTALPRALKALLGSGAAGKQAKDMYDQYLRGGKADPSSRLIFNDERDGSAVRDNPTTEKALEDFVTGRLWPAVDATPHPALSAPATPTSVSLQSLGINTDAVINWSPVRKAPSPLSFPGVVAGGTGQASPTLGGVADKRFFGGSVEYIPDADAKGVLTGLTAVADLDLTVQDSIDFCPGNLGPALAQPVTTPASKLEVTQKGKNGGTWATPFLFEIHVTLNSGLTGLAYRERRVDVNTNDPDSDGWPDTQPWTDGTYTLDNCPGIANPTQADANNDGIGDMCAASGGLNLKLPFKGNVKVTVLSRDAVFGQPLQVTSPVEVNVCDDCQGGESVDLGTQEEGAMVAFLEGGVPSSDPSRAKLLSSSSDTTSATWTVGFEDGLDADYNDLVVNVVLSR